MSAGQPYAGGHGHVKGSVSVGEPPRAGVVETRQSAPFSALRRVFAAENRGFGKSGAGSLTDSTHSGGLIQRPRNSTSRPASGLKPNARSRRRSRRPAMLGVRLRAMQAIRTVRAGDRPGRGLDGSTCLFEVSWCPSRPRATALKSYRAVMLPPLHLDASEHAPNACVFRDDAFGARLYHADCLGFMDAVSRPSALTGLFDAIFADPPYFLSNGGITCHAGRMVRVDKGSWDKSQGSRDQSRVQQGLDLPVPEAVERPTARFGCLGHTT